MDAIGQFKSIFFNLCFQQQKGKQTLYFILPHKHWAVTIIFFHI